MDKWILPTAIGFVVLAIFFPWILLVPAATGAYFLLSHLYFTRALPPPYLGLDGDANLRLNWLVPRGHDTFLEIINELGDAITFTPSTTANEYTGRFAVASTTLLGLSPGMRYRYMIWRTGPKGRKRRLFGGRHYWFLAPGTGFPDRPVRVAALGDLQPKRLPPILQQWILRQVGRENVDLLLYLGDHTMEGVDPVLWRYFLHIIGPVARNVPMLGVPGNHDLSLKRKGKNVIGKKAYETHVNYPDPKLYYGVHVHGIHVLALQFKATFDEGSEQDRFVKEQLQRRAPGEWLVTLWHSSPYNSLKPSPEAMDMRRCIEPKVREAGGKLWLGGHEHAYQRYSVNGVEFVTTAATSSFHRHHDSFEHQTKLVMKFHHCLLVVSPGELQLQAVSLCGRPIDEFTLQQ